jgi:hypothetical protein
VFGGDTLFKGGPGATGRSYSDFPTIIESIRDRLLVLRRHGGAHRPRRVHEHRRRGTAGGQPEVAHHPRRELRELAASLGRPSAHHVPPHLSHAPRPEKLLSLPPALNPPVSMHACANA